MTLFVLALLFGASLAKVEWQYCDVAANTVEVSPRGDRFVTLYQNSNFESRREPQTYCLFGQTNEPGKEMCRRCALDLRRREDHFKRSFIMYLLIFTGCGLCLLYMTDH